jgi:hypothetical protein
VNRAGQGVEGTGHAHHRPCVCLVGADLFALQLPQLRALVRPIYSQKGILPAVATGLSAATEVTSATREG